MFGLKKINHEAVHKIEVPKTDPTKIKGYQAIPELYANIFICARKKQGKTVLLGNLLDKCASKDTHIYFFVSTIMKDTTYREILAKLFVHGINFTCFISIADEGVDHLKKIVDELKNTPLVEGNTKPEEKEPKILNFNEDEDSITIKIRKPAKIAPKYIFVFDDMSAEIKNNPSVRELLKQNRHYKSKVIISSQYVMDLAPDSRAMIDVWLLFGGHNDDKLKEIYECSDPMVDWEVFKKMYEDATQEKYNFFYIDKSNGQYRKNFNSEYLINDIKK